MALLETPLSLYPVGMAGVWTFPALDRYTGEPLPNCSRPINYGVRSNVLSVEFDSGHTQRRVKAPPKMTFDVRYNALSLTEYRTLRDFFMLVLTAKWFMWTDPVEKIQYRVLFQMDTMQATQKGHGPKGPWYELSLQMAQTWD